MNLWVALACGAIGGALGNLLGFPQHNGWTLVGSTLAGSSTAGLFWIGWTLGVACAHRATVHAMLRLTRYVTQASLGYAVVTLLRRYAVPWWAVLATIAILIVAGHVGSYFRELEADAVFHADQARAIRTYAQGRKS